MNDIITTSISQALSYEEYKSDLEEHAKSGKTSGPVQSESLIGFTVLNFQRMKRLDKTLKINDELTKQTALLKGKYIWLVITEYWCGDAAQILPIFKKLEELNPEHIKIQLVFRDKLPTLMDLYLTNGARSIPKLIVINENTKEVVATWGPRPVELQEIVLGYKNKPDIPYDEVAKEIQIWYNKDKALSTQQEIFELIRTLE